jgi:hypothetical protein
MTIRNNPTAFLDGFSEQNYSRHAKDFFAQIEFSTTFAVPKQGKPLKRELSSAGSEHLPYKQRVGGSNPSAPTERQPLTKSFVSGFFICTFHLRTRLKLPE